MMRTGLGILVDASSCLIGHIPFISYDMPHETLLDSTLTDVLQSLVPKSSGIFATTTIQSCFVPYRSQAQSIPVGLASTDFLCMCKVVETVLVDFCNGCLVGKLPNETPPSPECPIRSCSVMCVV